MSHSWAHFTQHFGMMKYLTLMHLSLYGLILWFFLIIHHWYVIYTYFDVLKWISFYYTHVLIWKGVYSNAVCGNWRLSCETLFSPSTMWVLSIKLVLSGLTTDAFIYFSTSPTLQFYFSIIFMIYEIDTDMHKL